MPILTLRLQEVGGAPAKERLLTPSQAQAPGAIIATAELVAFTLTRCLWALLPEQLAAQHAIRIEVREPVSMSRGRSFVVEIHLMTWKDWIVEFKHLIDGALREKCAERMGPIELYFLPWVFDGDSKIPKGVIANSPKNSVEIIEGHAALRFMPTLPPAAEFADNEFPATILTGPHPAA